MTPPRPTRWLALLLSIVLAAAACGGGESDTGRPGSPGSPAPGTSPGGSPVGSPGRSPDGSPPASPESPDASPGGGEGTFQNPVLERNFADPFVLRVGDTYYAYATGNLTFNIQVSTSENLVDWSLPREALPRLPRWQPSAKGLTWAPEVIETSAGFVMHYTARDVQAGRQCLAVAVAEEPSGPFVDESDGPLVCQLDLGGSIDSNPFVDEDGTPWLLWKNDGNCCGIPTRFYMQEMSEDGLTLSGAVHDLGVQNDRPWERDVIEAPTLWLHDGTYYLFYSANGYNTRNYAVGYATSDTLLGPYTDAPENPILATRAPVGSPAGDAAGPGHQSIVEDDDGDLWFAYHAWDVALVGDQLGGKRSLWLDPLEFRDGKPIVDGPNPDPQPVP